MERERDDGVVGGQPKVTGEGNLEAEGADLAGQHGHTHDVATSQPTQRTLIPDMGVVDDATPQSALDQSR